MLIRALFNKSQTPEVSEVLDNREEPVSSPDVLCPDGVLWGGDCGRIPSSKGKFDGFCCFLTNTNHCDSIKIQSLCAHACVPVITYMVIMNTDISKF